MGIVGLQKINIGTYPLVLMFFNFPVSKGEAMLILILSLYKSLLHCNDYFFVHLPSVLGGDLGKEERFADDMLADDSKFFIQLSLTKS